MPDTLELLAVRYGLPGAEGSNGLGQGDLEFLKELAAHRAGDEPPDTRPLLDLASNLGYLSMRELMRIGFQAGYQGADRDYRVASIINLERLMPPSRIIDLLERIALPLFYCAHNRAVFYPPSRAAARRPLLCPSCQLQLIPLTTIPALNLQAPPLVDIGGQEFSEMATVAHAASDSGVVAAVAVAMAEPVEIAEPMDVDVFDELEDDESAEFITAPVGDSFDSEVISADPFAEGDDDISRDTGVAQSVKALGEDGDLVGPESFDDLEAYEGDDEPAVAEAFEEFEEFEEFDDDSIEEFDDFEAAEAAEGAEGAEPTFEEFDDDSIEEFDDFEAAEAAVATPVELEVGAAAEATPVDFDDDSIEELDDFQAEAVEIAEPIEVDEFADLGDIGAVEAAVAIEAAELVETIEPIAPVRGVTKSFSVNTGPHMVRDRTDKDVPLVEVITEEAPTIDVGIANDTMLYEAFDTEDRALDEHEELFSKLLLRYRLMDPERLEQVLHLWSSRDPSFPGYLVANGHLTAEGHDFLQARVPQVQAASGMGPIGHHHDQGVVGRAYELGYLTPQEVDARLSARGLSIEDDPLSILQVLYNHGHLELFQLVDLLEGRGILLWHCPTCLTQIPEVDVQIQCCPNDNGPLICMTGWGDPAAADVPLPHIVRLIGAVDPTLSIRPAAPMHAEAEPTPSIAFGMIEEVSPGDSQIIPAPVLAIDSDGDVTAAAAALPVAEAVEVAEVADEAAAPRPRRADPAQVRQVVLQYHLLTRAEINEAIRQVVPGTALIDILDRFGYLKDAAIRFLKRQLGMAVRPRCLNIGDAVKRYGYTSSIPSPLGIVDGDLPVEVEVPLTAEAYNMGFLPLYQLYDVLDTVDVQLEFCSYCQNHYHVTDAMGFDENCPDCDAALEPVTGSRAIPTRNEGEPLQRFNRLRIKPYIRNQLYESGVMLAVGATDTPEVGEKIGAAPSPTPAPPLVLPEHDQLISTLVESYLILSGKELNKAWNKREFSEHYQMQLDDFLRTDGWLGEREFQFIRIRNQQLRSGQAGNQTGFSVGELGISKGYINRPAFVELMQTEDAPSREDGEASIAAYLFNHRALAFYQVIDLLECCAVLLMACPDCNEQFQIDDFEGEREYPCPICWQPLLSLTIPPGRRPRLVQVPPIEQFHVFRINAEELPEMS